MQHNVGIVRDESEMQLSARSLENLLGTGQAMLASLATAISIPAGTPRLI